MSSRVMSVSSIVVKNARNLPSDLRGGVVAIGNFDGVHRGHRSVLDVALNVGRKKSIPCLVLTFEPHPRTWFKPEQPVFRLTPSGLKCDLLAKLGFEGVVEEPFDADFSSRSAEEFVLDILIRDLGVSHVVVGHDFHFGKARKGTPQFLGEMGKRHDFGVELIEAVTSRDDRIISSSRIRDALSKGDISLANRLLGYAYRVSGKVIKGQQLGRTLGFPTANLALPVEATLAHGIYAVRVQFEDGTMGDGVASYGRRPTFDNGPALLETFLFDFDENLYDREITVYLHSWLREELKFESGDALVEQMKKDSTEARTFLNSLPQNSGLIPVYVPDET